MMRITKQQTMLVKNILTLSFLKIVLHLTHLKTLIAIVILIHFYVNA